MTKKNISVYIQLPGHEGDPTRLDQTENTVITGPNGERLSAVAFSFESLLQAVGDKSPRDTLVLFVTDSAEFTGADEDTDTAETAQAESSKDPVILSFNDGGMVINTETYEVYLGDGIVHFSAKEYDLLRYLAANSHRVCTRKELLDNIWGEGYDIPGPDRTLDVHIKRVRDRLSIVFGDGCVKTQRSIGYRLMLSRDCEE